VRRDLGRACKRSRVYGRLAARAHTGGGVLEVEVWGGAPAAASASALLTATPQPPCPLRLEQWRVGDRFIGALAAPLRHAHTAVAGGRQYVFGAAPCRPSATRSRWRRPARPSPPRKSLPSPFHEQPGRRPAADGLRCWYPDYVHAARAHDGCGVRSVGLWGVGVLQKKHRSSWQMQRTRQYKSCKRHL